MKRFHNVIGDDEDIPGGIPNVDVEALESAYLTARDKYNDLVVKAENAGNAYYKCLDDKVFNTSCNKNLKPVRDKLRTERDLAQVEMNIAKADADEAKRINAEALAKYQILLEEQRKSEMNTAQSKTVTAQAKVLTAETDQTNAIAIAATVIAVSLVAGFVIVMKMRK